MPKLSPFKTHTARYEAWFDKHIAAYHSELQALQAVLPANTNGLEIGVGSGRFASPLGIKTGVDPCTEMLAIAKQRGIHVVQGIAEQLPFGASCFDVVLVVTTLCFVDSPLTMLNEAHRVLRANGKVIIGFIDRDSHLGREYQKHQAENVFYRDAKFYTTADVFTLLKQSGFKLFSCTQTLTHRLEATSPVEPASIGYGDGAFIVIVAQKSIHDRERAN